MSYRYQDDYVVAFIFALVVTAIFAFIFGAAIKAATSPIQDNFTPVCHYLGGTVGQDNLGKMICYKNTEIIPVPAQP